MNTYKPSDMAAAILSIPNFIAAIVNAPPGANVTLEKDGKTYTAKESPSGVYTAYVLEYGTYNVKIVFPDDEFETTIDVVQSTVEVKSETDYIVDENNNAITFGGDMIAVRGKMFENADAISPHIYGVEWDGSNKTALTRTDDSAEFAKPYPAVGNGTGSSPFDTLMPWAGMVRVTDPAAGELVAIPKFWYKLEQNGKAIKIQIADYAADGFHVSPAHMERGDGKTERDIVYVGRYHCGDDYKSEPGSWAWSNISIDYAHTNIHTMGHNIWLMDFAMLFTIWLLYIVEFADWDSQDTIGMGCCPKEEEQFDVGHTDAMKYHTGTDQISRDIYGSIQYRNIEGLWDNVYDWLGGCYYNSNGLNIVLNPATVIDYQNPSGGVLVGKPTDGYPSALTASDSGDFPIFYPTEANGTESSYIPDVWAYMDVPCYLYCGGCFWYQSLDSGLFAIFCDTYNTEKRWVGCRLMKLP